jgi:hypothetical protein
VYINLVVLELYCCGKHNHSDNEICAADLTAFQYAYPFDLNSRTTRAKAIISSLYTPQAAAYQARKGPIDMQFGIGIT